MEPLASRVLVTRPDGLDAAWAARVLAAHAPAARVSAVERAEVDVGTTTRVLLRVDHDGPADLPRRWFIKLPSASWKAKAITALPRLPQTEVRFYREVAPRVPVAVPRVLAAASRLGRGFILVLGDVTCEGATPGRPTDALGSTRAAAMLALLARLHASHWAAESLSGELAWLAGPVRRLEDRLGTALAVPLMRRGLRRAGDAVPEALHSGALQYARRRRAAMRRMARGPRTLVHHDCHPGNLYWRGDVPGLLDWQLVRTGDPLGDVAYLLATAVAPEVRREHEPSLLAGYRQALVDAGAPAQEPADVERRYREHLTYALEAMVVTLAVGGLMDEPVVGELIRRAALAAQDHDAFAAVLD